MENMETTPEVKQATVKGEVKFTGPCLFGFKDATVLVTPSEEEGIRLRKQGEKEYALLSLDNVHATRGKKAKARYVQVTNTHNHNHSQSGIQSSTRSGNQSEKEEISRYCGFLVTEHLAAAMHLAGITNADITFYKKRLQKGSSVPTCGPGIENFFRGLCDKKRELGSLASGMQVTGSSSYASSDGNIEREIIVEPSDKLEIIVESEGYKDLPKLGSDSIHITDAYQELAEHVKARPLARLGSTPIYGLWKLSKVLGYRGVDHESYIIVTPRSKAEDIVQRMQPKYRGGKNEHLYHTALDFFGELYSLGSPDIKGRFMLKNTTHLTRVPALKSFSERGVFQRTSAELGDHSDKRLTFYTQ